jgi:hypothetical protein
MDCVAEPEAAVAPSDDGPLLRNRRHDHPDSTGNARTRSAPTSSAAASSQPGEVGLETAGTTVRTGVAPPSPPEKRTRVSNLPITCRPASPLLS